MCEWYIFGVSGNEFMVNAVRLDIWVPRDSGICFHRSKYSVIVQIRTLQLVVSIIRSCARRHRKLFVFERSINTTGCTRLQ